MPLPPDKYGTASTTGSATGIIDGQPLPKDESLVPLFTGDQLESANPSTDENGRPAVAFALKSDAAKKFADYTSANVGNFFAIVLDGTVISAPSINSAITGGTGIITTGSGPDAVTQMNELVTVLRYGSLPFPVQAVQDTQISATLGAEFLQSSLIAAVIGIGLVFSFMLIYYRLPGLVADFALLYYAIVVLAVFRLIPVTLTLAGIAGFVLSVGMAVDANILIFERTKEELRLGKTLPSAVEAGFARAWNSILDSNVSSLITAGILYAFGSPDDQGLRARPDHRRAHVDVHRGDGLQDAPAGRRPAELRATGEPVGRRRGRVPGPDTGTGTAPGPRPCLTSSANAAGSSCSRRS